MKNENLCALLIFFEIIKIIYQPDLPKCMILSTEMVGLFYQVPGVPRMNEDFIYTKVQYINALSPPSR